MPPDPLVSVVMPVRDGERYLAEAVESVLSQDHPRIELIVVDDGSSDGTAALARSWGGALRCISTPARGIGPARNRGVEEASGEVIAFMDADDHCPTDRISLQMEALRGTPPPDLVFGSELRFPDARAVPEPAVAASTMLASRAVFDRVGPFSAQWAVGEFMEWLLRARELGLWELVLPDVVLHRRIHADNHTLRHRQHFGDYAEILHASLARRRAAGA